VVPLLSGLLIEISATIDELLHNIKETKLDSVRKSGGFFIESLVEGSTS